MQNQSHDSVFQPSENLHFESFCPGPTMVGPIVETGYERMFNTIEKYQIQQMIAMFALFAPIVIYNNSVK